jgi:hypothetical protein
MTWLPILVTTGHSKSLLDQFSGEDRSTGLFADNYPPEF